jgi:hypothetical protein
MSASASDALIFLGISTLALVVAIFFRRGVAARRLEEEEYEVLPGNVKRCSRCMQVVSSLRPYVSGRGRHDVCAMCAAEMDFESLAKLRPPSS